MNINSALLLNVSGLLALCACSAGSHHTSDAELKRRFASHEVQFTKLLNDIQAEEQLGMVGLDTLNYAGHTFMLKQQLAEMERLGLKGRWDRYQAQLNELGLVIIVKNDDSIEFRTDGGSLTNGDSYKGYQYNLGPPKHVKVSLDHYQIDKADKDSISGGYFATTPLKGNWSLYLFVNP